MVTFVLEVQEERKAEIVARASLKRIPPPTNSTNPKTNQLAGTSMLPATGQQSASQDPSQGEISATNAMLPFVMNIFVKQYWFQNLNCIWVIKISHCLEEAQGQVARDGRAWTSLSQ